MTVKALSETRVELDLFLHSSMFDGSAWRQHPGLSRAMEALRYARPGYIGIWDILETGIWDLDPEHAISGPPSVHPQSLGTLWTCPSVWWSRQTQNCASGGSLNVTENELGLVERDVGPPLPVTAPGAGTSRQSWTQESGLLAWQKEANAGVVHEVGQKRGFHVPASRRLRQRLHTAGGRSEAAEGCATGLGVAALDRAAAFRCWRVTRCRRVTSGRFSRAPHCGERARTETARSTARAARESRQQACEASERSRARVRARIAPRAACKLSRWQI